jgi:hypothetical protein
MKGMIAGLCVLLLILGSCSNKKAKEAVSSLMSSEDSMNICRLREDSLAQNAKGRSRNGLDELFNDFIYNFASDNQLQMKRILFPLLVTADENAHAYIDANHWKHDYLFTKQKIYSLLFDREKDMDLVNDTALNAVQVEWLYPRQKMIKKYFFKRIKGIWLLESIDMRHMKRSNDESFLDFYDHFVSDSTFQAHRVCQPLKFVTTDPDNDFSVIEATIDVNQWFAFKPELPIVQLSNINYGQQDLDNSTHKIVALKGVGNGFSNVLYFRKVSDKWKLYKFEDTSI